MPGMSIHVVDVSRGVVAVGMRVEVRLLNPPRLLCAGRRRVDPGPIVRAQPLLLMPRFSAVRVHRTI